MKKQNFATGSGNIFIDFGFSEEEAAGLSIQACLFRKLQQAIKESGLTRAELVGKLGVSLPHISDIKNGKMSGFSTEQVAMYLLRLNYDICVGAHPARKSKKARVVEVA